MARSIGWWEEGGAGEKKPVEILRGCLPYFLDADAPELCQAGGDDSHPGRFVTVFATAPGMGRKIWSVGFDQQTIVGDKWDDGWQYAGVGKGHRTGKGEVTAQLQAAPCYFLISGETMHHNTGINGLFLVEDG